MKRKKCAPFRRQFPDTTRVKAINIKDISQFPVPHKYTVYLEVPPLPLGRKLSKCNISFTSFEATALDPLKSCPQINSSVLPTSWVTYSTQLLYYRELESGKWYSGKVASASAGTGDTFSKFEVWCNKLNDGNWGSSHRVLFTRASFVCTNYLACFSPTWWWTCAQLESFLRTMSTLYQSNPCPTVMN